MKLYKKKRAPLQIDWRYTTPNFENNHNFHVGNAIIIFINFITVIIQFV